MGSLGTPQTWVPYDNLKDCSQGFCSLYCPQWCYINFAPPPPYGYPDDDSSGTNFSPLVIAIIGILASAFLLVSYYTVISKYCGNFDSLRRRGGDNNSNDESNENENPSNLEPWQVSTTGLDEKLIKSITVCKYKKGDGFVEGTDCSVCLSEFQEDESLRLLPKCSHAFHLYCIDTWLKSHSNCPLCRTNIVPISPLPLQLPSQVQQNPSSPTQPENIVVAMDELETRNNEEVVPQNDDDVHQDDAVAKTPNMENSEARDRIIEIREEETEPIRRSVSMDASCHDRVSMADILCMSEDEASSMDDQEHHIGIESSSKLPNVNEHNKYSNRSRVLHSVASPVPMKRSFSSGRFLFTRQGRGKNVIMPMRECSGVDHSSHMTGKLEC